ncbi:MAG: hemerythrin domain-containing protein [Flavobacteriaceae bacterium]|nr:hemerythrin domain-containing protein [Flavobacteriaceae bacterium]
MQHIRKTYISPATEVAELINENYHLLLFLEHLNIDFLVYDKTVQQVCEENNIDLNVFIVLGNLYNGFFPNKEELDSLKDIELIILFLRNSHLYYRNEVYPKILKYISILRAHNTSKDIALVERFFKDYFNEVVEHMGYEDEIVFPYFSQLLRGDTQNSNFSVKGYREHHSDIEVKLSDLKNLLLKHIVIKNERTTRRKFLHTLFELEFDLGIHSSIEEKILLPLIENIEKEQVHG